MFCCKWALLAVWFGKVPSVSFAVYKPVLVQGHVPVSGNILGVLQMPQECPIITHCTATVTRVGPSAAFLMRVALSPPHLTQPHHAIVARQKTAGTICIPQVYVNKVLELVSPH